MKLSILQILKSENWESLIQCHFIRYYEHVLKDVINTYFKYQKSYYGNILIWSFFLKRLFPIFNIKNNFNESVFTNIYFESLKSFSFTKAIVENDISDICCFKKNDFNTSFNHNLFWNNYFCKSNSVPKYEGKDLRQLFFEINKNSKIFFEDIMKDKENNIVQVSLIPIITGTSQKKVGGVFSFYSSIYINDEILSVLQRLISGIISSIPIQELEFITLSHATRAAISQVMSRNLSHNIGSHVMSHLTSTHFINNFEFCENCERTISNYKNIKKDVCNGISCTLKNYIGLESIKFEEGKDKKDKLLYLLFVHNDYIKTRMEYISDISFGEPMMATTKKVIGEIFRCLDENRLLLNFISGTNDFKYCFKLQKNGKDINSEKDIEVTMPNDVLGQQALYNIIENFIRNTAKHNQGKVKDKTVVFTLNFIEDTKEPDYYQIEMYDNIDSSDIDEELEKSERKNEKEKIASYFELVTSSEIKKIQSLVYKLNTKLNDTILNKETNRVRDNSLGLLEMEASACYLRMMDVNNIESSDYDLPEKYKNKDFYKNKADKYNILRAFIKGDKHLGYSFFILKPKDFLMVDFEKPDNKIQGVDFITKNDLETELKKGTKYRHQFVIFKNSKCTDFNKFKNQLPYRLLSITEEDDCIKKIIKKADKKELELCIWNRWWEKIKGEYTCVNILNSYQEKDFDHSKIGRYNLCLSDHVTDQKDVLIEQLVDKEKPKLNFLEFLSSKAQQTLTGFNTTLSDYFSDVSEKVVIKYKLFEAAKSNILILDERVQRLFETESYFDISYKKLYTYANIYVPFTIEPNEEEYKGLFEKYLSKSEKTAIFSIDLGKDNYDENQIENFKNFIKKLKDNFFEIIVIHYSIIERMSLKDTEGSKDLTCFIDELYKKCNKVVITSGRGKSKEISALNVGFVNLSSLLNAVHIIRSKYLLYQLLTNSKK